MQIPFYKLQLGGNGFLLIDLTRAEQLKPASYAKAAVRLCDRRYGVGASGCIFMGTDNELRFFTSAGSEAYDADDAFLCAARYAFDSGRITETGRKKSIVFKTARGETPVRVISSREFRLPLGPAFAAFSGSIITPDSADVSEVINIDEKAIRISAIHIHEDILTAFFSVLGKLNFQEFGSNLQKQFSGRMVHPVLVHVITREAMSVRIFSRGMSVSCASAAAAVVSGALSGISDYNAVVVFEQGNPDPMIQEANLSRDEDNSRKLAILWDTEKNELFAVGTGGYVFDGSFDFQ